MKRAQTHPKKVSSRKTIVLFRGVYTEFHVSVGEGRGDDTVEASRIANLIPLHPFYE